MRMLVVKQGTDLKGLGRQLAGSAAMRAKFTCGLSAWMRSSVAPDAVLSWGDPMWGFADVWQPATAALHLAGGVTPHQVAVALDGILEVSDSIMVARAARGTP